MATDDFPDRVDGRAGVVELRYFGGLGEEEVAEVLGLSRATVARDWRVARMLLGRMLGAGTGQAATP